MIRLKIRKTKSGTYYIPSLSIKQLQKLSKKHKRRWALSKNGENTTKDTPVRYHDEPEILIPVIVGYLLFAPDHTPTPGTLARE